MIVPYDFLMVRWMVTIFAFIPAVLGAFLFRYGKQRQQIQHAAVFGLGVIVMVLVWL